MVGIDSMLIGNSEQKYNFKKRCINCDNYGYKTKDDYKYGRKYCFATKAYINKPNELVCRNWIPTD